MRKILLTLFAIGILAISLSAQLIDDYGTKPPTRERQQAVVKFHVALELLNGHYTPEQKAVLVNAIADPKAFDENNLSLFSTEQVKEIFYLSRMVNIGKFRTAYKMPVLADRRLYYVSLDKQGRAEAWRGWFAYEIATGRITDPGQINEVIRLSDYLDRQDVSELDGIALELQQIFPDKEQAREVFGSIGPYVRLGVFCKGSGPAAKTEGSDCYCSRNHYNWICNDACGGSGGCNTTDGGCSIFWLRNCDGTCSTGDVIVQ